MTGIVDFRTELLDDSGNPISNTNPLPTTGGGGGGSLADVLLTDDTGALFVARDDGTTVTFFNLNTNAVYTPSGTIAAVGLTNTQLRAEPVNVTLSGDTVLVQDEAAEFMLTRVLNALNAPQGYDRSLQRQRGTVVVESGTLTAVNSVANVALLDNLQPRIQVYGANLSAWADTVRARIT